MQPRSALVLGSPVSLAQFFPNSKKFIEVNCEWKEYQKEDEFYSVDWPLGHCAHGAVEEPEMRIHADEEQRRSQRSTCENAPFRVISTAFFRDEHVGIVVDFLKRCLF